MTGQIIHIARFIAFLSILTLTTLQAVDGAPSSDGRTHEVRQILSFPDEALILESIDGYTLVRFPDCIYPQEPGLPMLPALPLRIALPAGMTVTGVHARLGQERELPGKHMVYPIQSPRPVDGSGGEFPLTTPDPETYASPHLYPAEPVRIIRQADLAGQSIAWLLVHPVRYVPSEGKILFSPSMEIVLTGKDGYLCKDHLPEKASSRTRAAAEGMIKGMVANPADVALKTSGGPRDSFTGVEPGAFEYVIITQESWVDDFQPLADWRIRKGIPSTIVTLKWIYNDGGYPGTNLEKVRAFIEDAHKNWGAAFFLLGGDSNLIPYHIRTITIPGYWTEDIPNDTYYADYDEDWVCEVHVGRAPVWNLVEINTFINKIFTYEKNPPLTNYATWAAFFGFDITVPGDKDGEICKENIHNLHLPASWTLHTEYDSEPGTHKADVLAYLDQGHHLVNHHDHCNTDCMGAGYTTHGDIFYIPDVNALTNGDRLSILFAVGCYPARFPVYTSIGEAFIRHPSGGAVAFMGNTCVGWGGPASNPDLYTVRQDRYLYRALFDEGFETLGACFTDLKNDEFDNNDPMNLHKYCFTQLTLLGDPEVPVWTEDPRHLQVTHGDTLDVGIKVPYTVSVKEGSAPLADVAVCLWKQGDLFEVGSTNAQGEAFFHITPASIGTLCVTAHRHNYLPYEGSAQVKGGELSVDVNQLSEITGGKANFTLVAGAAKASQNYLLLGGVSGTNPGLPLPGGHAMSLNWDAFTGVVIAAINTPLFLDFMGALDMQGNGTAQLNTLGPIPPGFTGTIMYFAYAAAGSPWSGSNPVTIEIVP